MLLTSLLKDTQGNSALELETELREKGLFNMVLTELNVKSKKKRIRRKVFKKAVSIVNVIEETTVIPEMSEPVSNDSPIVLDKLPVTFLLKLGKQYFKNEDVVKYYYNSTKTEFYKNKGMLLSVLNEKILVLSSKEKADIISLIETQQKKKADA